LQARQREHALSAPFGDDARETGEGGDVRELIKREQETSALVVAVVGSVHELLYESDHERDANRLVAARGDHVELVRAAEELLDIERSLASRRPSGLGTNTSEESCGRRPDARSLAIFGREDTVEK
jgi:hypothetical protein